jgi:hypothetical protein
MEFVNEIIGDILPVKIKFNAQDYNWYASPSKKAVHLMGLENMMFALIDYPDEYHSMYRHMVDDVLAHYKWMEKEGLLIPNNENDYAGSGSYGFTDELPTEECNKTGIVTTKDMWVNLNSQETVSVSPAMYGEFFYPYYYDLAKEFGMVYYGCCEPVHPLWEDYISKLPGLRKVSISPWCDEEFMGEALRGGNVIYSRKPSPNFLALDQPFDEEAYKEHIAKTLKAAKGCELEIICRDVYALYGDKTKLGKGVKIIREQIEKLW